MPTGPVQRHVTNGLRAAPIMTGMAEERQMKLVIESGCEAMSTRRVQNEKGEKERNNKNQLAEDELLGCNMAIGQAEWHRRFLQAVSGRMGRATRGIGQMCRCLGLTTADSGAEKMGMKRKRPSLADVGVVTAGPRERQDGGKGRLKRLPYPPSCGRERSRVEG